MPYDIQHREETAHVHLAGALTFAEHHRFRQLVNRLCGQGAGRVVLDLSRVDHIDAAGLGLLLVARDSVRNRGGMAELSGADGRVGRMLRLSRFHELFHQ